MPKEPLLSKKSPHPRDHDVGRRIRARRLERGMSQSELGGRLGVTFQQIQKYEKGVNRVGAGRLYQIAEVLSIPVSFFFGGHESGSRSAKEDSIDAGFRFLETAGAVRIVRAYSRIGNHGIRRALVALAERIADGKE
jgi:transcriptional regulator with XRE-family HTH domain